MRIAVVLLAGLSAVAVAACTGPRTQLPNYEPAGSGSAVAGPATATAPAPTRAWDEVRARRELATITTRLTNAILAPEMCQRLDCPGGPYTLEIVDSDAVNAATDGRTIYVARGLVQFVGNEGELAAVMAHEIAHGLLDHRTSKQQDAVVGSLLGAAVSAAIGADVTNLGANIGALSYSKAYEREADYVGLYILARAGYYLGDAYTMWQRMSGISASRGTFLDSHPAFAERLGLLRATNDEIAAKMNRGLPVVPELRR